VDREAIERRDFPVGRRGYDQAAVDAHLRRVADELEALTAGAPTLAAGTSEHVRVILEAAEASAAELRADAARRADEHVARVEQAAGAMMARIDELERELGSLLEALRRSGEKLGEGLARLHEQAGELGAAAGDEGRDPAPAVDADGAGPASD
jgi:DivIVA domain-containing protein